MVVNMNKIDVQDFLTLKQTPYCLRGINAFLCADIIDEEVHDLSCKTVFESPNLDPLIMELYFYN